MPRYVVQMVKKKKARKHEKKPHPESQVFRTLTLMVKKGKKK